MRSRTPISGQNVFFPRQRAPLPPGNAIV